MSATSSLLPGTGRPAPTAIEINARASEGFDAKLAETVALLREAAQLGPATQASSLGAEDMVITHLINAHALPISIFVLETGALHAETLALLEQLQAQQATHPHAPLTIYRPQADAIIRFVAREGKDAMYQSIELRKACCSIRKMEPLSRALAGQKAWLTGLRREQSGARAEVPLIDTTEQDDQGTAQVQPAGQLDLGRRLALHRAEPGRLQPAARPVFPQHRLRALHPSHQPG
jgi:phosphoadenosine phosphosulfate reductase